jgi:hypothetical protein
VEVPWALFYGALAGAVSRSRPGDLRSPFPVPYPGLHEILDASTGPPPDLRRIIRFPNQEQARRFDPDLQDCPLPEAAIAHEVIARRAQRGDCPDHQRPLGNSNAIGGTGNGKRETGNEVPSPDTRLH